MTWWGAPRANANHKRARDILVRRAPAAVGYILSPVATQMIMAVSFGEGVYGEGVYLNADALKGTPDYKPINGVPVEGTWNWGAVQSRDKVPCVPGRSVEISDSSPKLKTPENPHGTYQVCLLTHPTQEDGADTFLRTLLERKDKAGRKVVLAAIDSGNVDAVATAMYATNYYGGFNADPLKAIDDYAKGLLANGKIIAKALGEPLLLHRGSPLGGAVGPVSVTQGTGLGLAVVVSAFLTLLGTAIARKR